MLLVSVRAPILVLSHANVRKSTSEKCHESTLAQAPQEKIVSPPVFTGGPSVIYGCLEVSFLRRCNLLLWFRVAA